MLNSLSQFGSGSCLILVSQPRILCFMTGGCQGDALAMLLMQQVSAGIGVQGTGNLILSMVDYDVPQDISDWYFVYKKTGASY